MSLIDQEREYREQMWERLLQSGGPKNVSPSTLRELKIYGGAQGIWVDKNRTGILTPGGYGVAVSLTHSGKSYPDDWSENGVIYHYPQTQRPAGRDTSEIEATKNAFRLKLPIFVITHTQHLLRDVYLGSVLSWDDHAKQFLVVFSDQLPSLPHLPDPFKEPTDDEPFSLFSHHKNTLRMVKERPNQQRFKFLVIKRYGAKCALCGIDIPALLQAAHIVPKEQSGPDDPRNGLVLCANHHLAFDMNLIAIHPDSLDICYSDGYDQHNLLITYKNLNHLSYSPHIESLKWRYHRWRQV